MESLLYDRSSVPSVAGPLNVSELMFSSELRLRLSMSSLARFLAKIRSGIEAMTFSCNSSILSLLSPAKLSFPSELILFLAKLSRSSCMLRKLLSATCARSLSCMSSERRLWIMVNAAAGMAVIWLPSSFRFEMAGSSLKALFGSSCKRFWPRWR